MRVLAIGDIHCKGWIIDATESVVDDYDKLVFVGDYVDDWGASPIESIATFKILFDFHLRHKDKVQFLVGNHDYSYIMSRRVDSSGFNTMTKVLLSTPENKHLKKWVEDMPVLAKYDGVVYSHAGVDKHWDGNFTEESLWSDVSPLWTRIYDTQYLDVPQVFGHTPVKTCTEVEEDKWCIDTFSTEPHGDPIGDYTVLEVIDGKKFNKVRLI